MTTISALIQSAYREGNLLAAGASPTANELTEAVAEYNSLVTNLLTFQRSNNLMDVIANAGATYPMTVSKHTRIVQQGGTGTINFPAVPDDGARMGLIQGSTSGGTLTLSGNGYTINGTATSVFAAPSAATEWFYRGDVGDWKVVKTFASSDDSIFPQVFDDMIQAYIFMRLASRYNKQISPSTQAVYDRGLEQFTSRYFQGARLDVAITNHRGQPQT